MKKLCWMLVIDAQVTKVRLLHLLWCEQNCHCWMFRRTLFGMVVTPLLYQNFSYLENAPFLIAVLCYLSFLLLSLCIIFWMFINKLLFICEQKHCICSCCTHALHCDLCKWHYIYCLHLWNLHLYFIVRSLREFPAIIHVQSPR